MKEETMDQLVKAVVTDHLRMQLSGVVWSDVPPEKVEAIAATLRPQGGDVSRYFHVPLEVATTPKDGEVLVGHWWAVHPEMGLAFWRRFNGDVASPQCNRNKRIADFVTAKTLPDHDVLQIPTVYLAHAEAP